MSSTEEVYGIDGEDSNDDGGDNTFLKTLKKKKKLFTTVMSQRNFFHGKFRSLCPGKASYNRAALPNLPVHAGCFSISIIHRTLTLTTGFLTCAQMLMHAFAHGGVRTHVRESALKADSGRKIPCR